MTPYERLEAVMRHYGMSTYDLAAKLGYNSPQVFYRIKNGGVKKISQSIAGRMKMAFPEVNEVWLLTDKGDMLLDFKDISESQDVDILRNEIRKLREEIKGKDETITNLSAAIVNLTKKLSV